MTKHEIKADLQDIRYYYTHKAMFDRAEDTGFKNIVVKKAERYGVYMRSVPGKRAKGYAEERKAKVHKWGDKEGKELTDYEAGMRSGYLQCQRDHGGMFKYGQARDAGFSKQEAGAMSKKPWKEIKDPIEKAKKSKGGK